jgi:hypothetical protein
MGASAPIFGQENSGNTGIITDIPGDPGTCLPPPTGFAHAAGAESEWFGNHEDEKNFSKFFEPQRASDPRKCLIETA